MCFPQRCTKVLSASRLFWYSLLVRIILGGTALPASLLEVPRVTRVSVVILSKHPISLLSAGVENNEYLVFLVSTDDVICGKWALVVREEPPDKIAYTTHTNQRSEGAVFCVHRRLAKPVYRRILT